MTEFTRTDKPPFLDAQRTGRAFISPCCTAGVFEFRGEDGLWLASHVAGHGWSAPWRGNIDDINDTGTKVDADGAERRVWWTPAPGET